MTNPQVTHELSTSQHSNSELYGHNNNNNKIISTDHSDSRRDLYDDEAALMNFYMNVVIVEEAVLIDHLPIYLSSSGRSIRAA